MHMVLATNPFAGSRDKPAVFSFSQVVAIVK